MAIKLKDLVAGQQKLENETPVRLNPDQFKDLVAALSAKAGPGAKSGSKIFEEFVIQTKKREELLKDATKEQRDIFKELEDTLKKLQTADHADSIMLRRSIDTLNRRLSATPNTAAKTKMTGMIPAMPASAAPKSSFAPTLVETDPQAEKAGTAGTAEVKPSSSGLMPLILTAIAGVTAAIGGIVTAVWGAIKWVGGLLLAPITGILEYLGLKTPSLPTGTNTPDGPEVMTDEKTTKEKKPKKGPKAKPKAKPKTGPMKPPSKISPGKLGLLGIATSILGNIAADALTDAGHENIGASVGVATDIAGYAGTGAIAGGFIGGPIGAAIGGIGGGLYGAYSGLKNRVSDDPAFYQGLIPANIAESKANKMHAQQIGPLQAENDDLKLDDRGRVIQILTPQMQNPMASSGGNPVFAPGPSIRPMESAYERHMTRNMMIF